MKICSLYGVGYYYIPGTDTCIKIGGYVRQEVYHNAAGGGYPNLWNPTGTECARYWLETYPADTHLRLEPSIWQDYPGSLS